MSYNIKLTQAYASIIDAIEPDISRHGISETPARAARAIIDYTVGYGMKEEPLYRGSFTDGLPSDPDELIIVSNIRFGSLCEHHLAPFFGLAHIGYLPSQRILGLSKFARLVDMFSRRLQVQERLTNQIADSLQEHLQPRAIGVVIHARHMCMEMRGVRQWGTITTTSALRGVMKKDPDLRSEFFRLMPSSQGVVI